MQVKNLPYLIELEKTGSINKAARNLYISQQGLSRIVDSLESELSCKLVERSRNGVRFTESGQVFLRHAHAIMADYLAMCAEIDALREDGSDSSSHEAVDLVLSTYASLMLLESFLPSLASEQAVAAREWSRGSIADALASGEKGHLYLLDWVSIREDATQRPVKESLEVSNAVLRPLLGSRFGLVCSASSRIARKTVISLEEAAQLPLACFSGQDYLDSMALAFGPDILSQAALKVSSGGAIVSFIRNNPCAVMITDEFSFSLSADLPADLAFVPLDSPFILTVGFAWTGGDESEVRFERFVEDARRVSKQSFDGKRRSLAP